VEAGFLSTTIFRGFPVRDSEEVPPLVEAMGSYLIEEMLNPHTGVIVVVSLFVSLT
jgi:hypothetical protein